MVPNDRVNEERANISNWEEDGGHLFETTKEKGFDDLVPHCLWGQHTNNSIKYFNIGEDLFDKDFIKAIISIKKSILLSNHKFKLIDDEYYELIFDAINCLNNNFKQEYFPVKIWQTGSGTQINMNVNEVIASLANKLGRRRNKLAVVHPNNHVNMSQSSNDVIPTALNITSIYKVDTFLIPALKSLEEELYRKEKEFSDILKIGRTHMMDAILMTLGQEFSSFVFQIRCLRREISKSLQSVLNLPLGGTAIGTGANCPEEVSNYAIELLSGDYNLPFKKTENLFSGVSTDSEIVALSANLKNLAVFLIKLSTDLTLLSSGPDTGLNEISLPENEAGSSIMPGKVNPTQCEALAMVSCEVIGNDYTLTLGALQGRLQLNTFRPLIIKNILGSVMLLSDAIVSFSKFCVRGIKPNLKTLKRNVENSRMVISYLVPLIGYDEAEKIVKISKEQGLSVKNSVLANSSFSKEEMVRFLNNQGKTKPPSLSFI